MVRKYILVFAAGAMLLAVLFTLTRPEKLPSIMLVVVFFVLYIVIISLLMALALAIRSAGGFNWNYKKLKKAVFGIGLVPIFLLVLQSIGQLTWRDVLLSLVFTAIGYFYYSRFFVTDNENV
jgi:hypothetical protein